MPARLHCQRPADADESRLATSLLAVVSGTFSTILRAYCGSFAERQARVGNPCSKRWRREALVTLCRNRAEAVFLAVALKPFTKPAKISKDWRLVHRVSCLVLKKKLDLGLIASGVFQGPGRFQGSGQKGLRLESVSLAIRILRYGAFKSLV